MCSGFKFETSNLCFNMIGGIHVVLFMVDKSNIEIQKKMIDFITLIGLSFYCNFVFYKKQVS